MASACSVHSFDRYRDAVAHAAFGEDDLRFGRIALDLATQSQDLHVDRPIVDLVVVAAAELDQLVAADDPIGGGEQGRKQIEFPVAEGHLAAVVRGQTPGAQIQLPSGNPVSATYTRPLRL